MVKKLLGIVVLSFLLSGNVYSKIILLNCPQVVFERNLGSIYYIDTVNEKVGRAYFDKKNKILNVYNWFYKNIIFEKEKITFNDPGRGLFGVYFPEKAWLAKTEIDRINIKTTHYQKDDSYEYYLDKYSYLPEIIKTKIAKKRAEWKWVDSVDCKVHNVKNKKNINFISEKEWSDQQKKENDEWEKEQKKKNKPKF